MAQNFRRSTSSAVGTSAVSVYTADSYDTIVGIALTIFLSEYLPNILGE